MPLMNKLYFSYTHTRTHTHVHGHIFFSVHKANFYLKITNGLIKKLLIVKYLFKQMFTLAFIRQLSIYSCLLIDAALV